MAIKTPKSVSPENKVFKIAKLSPRCPSSAIAFELVKLLENTHQQYHPPTTPLTTTTAKTKAVSRFHVSFVFFVLMVIFLFSSNYVGVFFVSSGLNNWLYVPKILTLYSFFIFCDIPVISRELFFLLYIIFWNLALNSVCKSGGILSL